jgi:hypothetical protein
MDQLEKGKKGDDTILATHYKNRVPNLEWNQHAAVIYIARTLCLA